MYWGREEEMRFLEEQYAAPEGRLVLLYGHRQVGKTEILRQFSKGKHPIFYTCTECTDEQQLTAFSTCIQRCIPSHENTDFLSGWKQALGAVSEWQGEGKKLLVIDDFPYMVQSSPAILSVLQELWDTVLQKQDMMLVLCGSNIPFMERELPAEDSPLYGRISEMWFVRELDFSDALRSFPRYSAGDNSRAFVILGGIPGYLKQFDDRLPPYENVRRHILTPGCFLYKEATAFLQQELQERKVYDAILTAMADGHTRLEDIRRETKIDSDKLDKCLSHLTDIGVICWEVPDEGDHQPAYPVINFFFRFWYTFVFPNLSDLEAGKVDEVWKNNIEPKLESYTDTLIEDVLLREKPRTPDEWSEFFSQDFRKANYILRNARRAGRTSGSNLFKDEETIPEQECFTSNCLLEAIRAKHRNPAVRWRWMPYRYSRWYWPHVVWEEDGYIYRFQCAVKGYQPWWKRIWFKGYLQRSNLMTWKLLLESKAHKQKSAAK